MTTKQWVNPRRDFYCRGKYYVAGTVFELPADQVPPKGSYELKRSTAPDPVQGTICAENGAMKEQL